MAQNKTPRTTIPTSSSMNTGGATATATRPSPKTVKVTHDQIAQRAHEIWLKRGCRPGEDERNWLEAEKQLRAELARK
jgi:hypothetical protein